MKTLILLSVIFYFGEIKAQLAPPKIASTENIISHYINNDLEIEFAVSKKTASLLVLLTDGTGHTVLLDDRYDFIGNYKRTITLGGGKGKYFLKVITDEGQTDKTFMIE